MIYDKILRDNLLKELENSRNGRCRICLHKSHEDYVQDMIIAMNNKSYVRPHLHPEKRQETYHVIEGELTVFFFDDVGNVQSRIKLNKEKPILKIFENQIHMPVVEKETACVFHEVLTGPFDKDKVVKYSEWAPEESNQVEIKKFLKRLVTQNEKNIASRK